MITVVPVYAFAAMLACGILMGAVYGDHVYDVEQDWRVRTAFR